MVFSDNILTVLKINYQYGGLTMARGRRKAVSNLTLEEQVASIQAEIDNLAEKMKDAKARKKELQDKISEREKEDVYRVFIQSGKTLEDLKVLLAER